MARWAGGVRFVAGLAGLAITAGMVATGCSRPRTRPGGGSPVAVPTDLPTRQPPALQPVDGASTPVADPVYPEFGNPAIDIQTYLLNLTWSPTGRTLAGTADLTLRVVRPVAEITLDFSPAYTISLATIDGQRAETIHQGNDLSVRAGRTLEPGTRLALSISYRGTPADTPFPGVRSDVRTLGARIDGTGALWAMQEPYGAFTWFPCNDQPSDKALFEVIITAPAGWSGVSSGELVSVTTARDGSTTTRWVGAAPSATYVLALAVDRFQRYSGTGPRDLPLTYWVRSDQADLMLPMLRRVPDMISWLERRFGRYPFTTAGVVVVPDRSAMETQTMVSIGPFAGYRGETVLLHELAHQWFGNAVTPSTWQDLWLNEGFATYIEMLYAVERLGADQAGMLSAWRAGDAQARAGSGPPARYDPRRFAEYNVYYGPALLLNEIRERVGDRVFFAMSHDWARHHQYRTVDRAGFEDWLDEYTDRDLRGLVADWLDSPVTPP